MNKLNTLATGLLLLSSIGLHAVLPALPTSQDLFLAQVKYSRPANKEGIAQERWHLQQLQQQRKQKEREREAAWHCVGQQYRTVWNLLSPETQRTLVCCSMRPRKLPMTRHEHLRQLEALRTR